MTHHFRLAYHLRGISEELKVLNVPYPLKLDFFQWSCASIRVSTHSCGTFYLFSCRPNTLHLQLKGVLNVKVAYIYI